MILLPDENVVIRVRRLNPCFGGSWVMIVVIRVRYVTPWVSLNPCFGGSWVMITRTVNYNGIVRKEGLNPCFGGSWVMIGSN